MFKKFIDKLKNKDKHEEGVKKDEAILLNDDEDIQNQVEDFEELEVEGDFPHMMEEERIEEYEPPTKLSLFQRLKEGLSKTKEGINSKIDELIKSYKKIDEDLFDELEEILITADIGVHTTMEVIDAIKDKVKLEKINEPEEIKKLLKDELKEILLDLREDIQLKVEPSPAIILVIGVNGVGKTTTIGKIAHRIKNEGKSVLLAAGDTFRAAAIDQLQVWGARAGVEVIRHQEGSDPAAVIFDAIQSAKSKKVDVLICDTAGRLHNKKNLMMELEKIFRVVSREYSNATREVLLVLDATTGQNAIQQAKIFNEAAEISGLVLTKLDGTAKGGVVIGISRELKVPVKFIGVGERQEDLQAFDAEAFVDALFGE